MGGRTRSRDRRGTPEARRTGNIHSRLLKMALALLDTNAISDLMQSHPKVVARAAAHSGLVLTSAIVVGEIEYGLNRLPAGNRRTGLEKRATAVISALR